MKLLNFCQSNGEARRLIRGNGVKLNDVSIDNENLDIIKKEFKGKIVKISAGKKRHGLINFK